MISKKTKKSIFSLFQELGHEVEKIKNTESIDISYKTDSSPITKADHFLNENICNYLMQTEIKNIISEESSTKSFSLREKWDYFWILDPIDGTKEFINKSNEYTINLALCFKNEPILSYVYAPGRSEFYFAEKENFSYLNGERICVKKIQENDINVVASKSHLNQKTLNFIEALQNEYNIKLLNYGSSLKICKVAEGKADIYPRFGQTMEWDICAADLILSEAGGELISLDNHLPLRYNKKSLVNPYFIAKSKEFNAEKALRNF